MAPPERALKSLTLGTFLLLWYQYMPETTEDFTAEGCLSAHLSTCDSRGREGHGNAHQLEVSYTIFPCT